MWRKYAGFGRIEGHKMPVAVLAAPTDSRACEEASSVSKTIPLTKGASEAFGEFANLNFNKWPRDAANVRGPAQPNEEVMR